METAVVRRGVGAIVLALIAALLLGYLLKGKAPERKQVVDKQTMPSSINIFPPSNGGSAPADSGSSGSGSTNVAAVGVIAAAGAAAAGALASDNGKNAEVRGSFNSSRDRLTDASSGNASMGKNRLVVDGAGQAIVDNKNAGARETPAQFSIRAPKRDEVRPVVDHAVSKNITKSNARLVGEKRLPPVGSRKVASSRDNTRVSSTRKVAKTPKPAASGRNKYSVQLLATSNLSKANNLKNVMEKEGYKAYVDSSKKGAGSLYRVRLGDFNGRADAVKKQADLKRRYQKNSSIQKSIVVRR